ncbi:tyrosine-type recombinase/integrase [Laribacter hongkongensis]|uniref:tyrosine-type recombinase/integrase n=1 Tax=Laribacter hongkongensis TaxID=168471 RepID=UPI001EFE89CE|nr:tyrosine-type recombinase/integrase [Laribacter hongkongensis]MCG8995595.1 tyrosine-type recombinase/integrase [Laribacter hongkongensis]MCG9009327.1 tyrosine-type recombinase/integrase [Laribacter hongkongensis]MCG9022646.1 tyrosine-type recombinase/integrase [Laribacter hongkongensis]MCG9045613.1 tyrosine-type recombinase/integrase [Laribacter hongkongensis]MCG9075039.1 tyrosine-type recombinase/integrase [Laribacter hongkongensis]
MKHGTYYYVTPGNKWMRLSKDLDEAKRKWVELEAPCRLASQGMAAIFNRYSVEVLAYKQVKTRSLQVPQLRLLEAAFGELRPDEVRPFHVVQYLDYRASQGAPVAGNREKQLLSHVFTMAMRWGIIDSNPCVGVTRNREKPRGRYVSDEELLAFIHFARNLKHGMLHQRKEENGEASHPRPTDKNYTKPLASGQTESAVLDIAFHAAQRRQDVLTLTLDDITNDGLVFRQKKTRDSAPVTVVVSWGPGLRSAVDYALSLPRKEGGRFLFDCRDKGRLSGHPYTDDGFSSLFQRIMRAWGQLGHERFTVHDLRAKGATDLLDQGIDAKETTGHASDSILRRVYDRRRVRKGTSVR